MANIQVQVKKQKKHSADELQSLSKEELIDKLRVFEAQNIQLRSLLARSLNEKKYVNKNKPFDFSKCTYRHILLKFYYLGWDYQGYAVQEDTNKTIEYYLFEALTKTCLIEDRTKANYHRCGRTDKGVSAFGQVVSIDIRSRLSLESQDKLDEEIDYCKLLNKVLPENIQCIAWCPAEENFSARFDCKARMYKYFFPKGTLNIEKMKIAATHMVGSHDFRNLCKMDVGNGVTQFIRNIHSIEFTCLTDNKTVIEDPYHMYVATVKAQSFLWHQIRCLIAILFLVGEEKEVPEVVLELLDVEKNSRKPEYNMASEVPLNLYHCEYEVQNEWKYNEENLAAVLNKLKKMWSFHSIKTSMIKAMLDDLENLREGSQFSSMSDHLLCGVKSKNYTPLLERKKCESLESKIKHYVKRKRLEIVDSEKSPS